MRQVAHRQPEIFVAGALAAGFLVGRFLKSSGRLGYKDNAGRQYGGARPGFRYASWYEYSQYGYRDRSGSSVATNTRAETQRGDWKDDPFSITQDIPVTGGKNDVG